MEKPARLIDREPEPPKDGAKVEVLVLGMPRTGTLSILAAFQALGYKPFHASMMEQYPHLLPLYMEAMQAKFEQTVEPYGRKEFDKLFLGKWNVSCNMPGSLMADELIAAYPNAKIILTTRDVDKWQHSMKESVDAAAKWKTFDYLASWDPDRIGLWWRYHKYQHALRPKLAPNGEKQAYLDHYKHINRIVPPERVLNYHVSEGWEPLCKFLGKEVPDVPFPNVNNKNSFLAGRRRRWFQLLRIMMGVILRKLAIPMMLLVLLSSLYLTNAGSSLLAQLQVIHPRLDTKA
ncbi:P-loop containing nucleoside triphosphate hydrolase protein [Fusarium flagelliforme]|uniref:Putative nad dependent epimerase dehydratase protein n=1 Tax=Fusarium flagelliforme TaxID=2675880 RepID=A0A395MTU2_9HYPO|nr:P-loop containing nucleoside triphosphate hydrolase protein [Fusarium flagelliforme]KAH7183659.1 P-loop containing nucleoside triphosphate hydrolase protein [Fusarium flagelliforme]RFN51364.1 putative nad dependent epimerase dehydratase protein [Fusarium flagelliforme]